MTPIALVQALVACYTEHQDGERAIAMAAYMKNRFPFYGIPMPQRKQLNKVLLPERKAAIIEAWLLETVQLLWQENERECQYAGLDLLERFSSVLTMQAIASLEALILQKSWWDTVDLLATKSIGELVLQFPELRSTMDGYSQHPNLWLRRTAILHQLKYKQKTDAERLFHYCIENAESKEFFIQKAIGWALREYAKTDSTAVVAFVNHHQKRLANLSQREALKHLPNSENLS
ncbi:MAG TPA: DNA alkylation repair protein [Leptolyngbyaceae cyanobacterium M33_DOE_097]|uniref:DNA alkylation repair protein n=1 Tax=Oscillatoriales cyanobacterium SpSt-418 TaxID=2282169 RepID=A0A7C3PH58_9CYAN|nr:DNA alkylation repair protein [Leptolyngbyaceae cyanobacterium M33_DOE_097]